MTDYPDNSKNRADDMSEYLQTFLDETEEQLDDLVETILGLEQDSANQEDLNEAFRLIHSIKGSAGIMGFEVITVLTHRLENRFERFRSGLERLDERTMNLVLRCIDFLRQCNDRLRDGAHLGSPQELLDDLRRLEEQADPSPGAAVESIAEATQQQPTDISQSKSTPSNIELAHQDGLRRIIVRFRAGLQLVDLKAQLMVNRLSGLGNVHSTLPQLERPADFENLDVFEIRIETEADPDRLRAAVDVEGVETADLSAAWESTDPSPDMVTSKRDNEQDPTCLLPRPIAVDVTPGGDHQQASHEPTDAGDSATAAPVPTEIPQEKSLRHPVTGRDSPSEKMVPASVEKTAVKVAETMRVGIDRLDNQMNLTGELVVNRARLEQISGQVSPALRKSALSNRVCDFRDSLRRTITAMESRHAAGDDWSAEIAHLRDGLELMDQQVDVWDNGRHCFSQMSDAIDQLSRVSHSLQRSVLETRMVPVGPLFNRFKRVVRDLSKERGKQVNLVIRGENTELDKRMIDELGDPLVHLVRNSIDHGLETCEVRSNAGKTESGTIVLEASHRGNHVFIQVEDDGQGIDVEKIRSKLIDRRVLTASEVGDLSDEQALEYIWHPGFSTAQVVTDVSGRGVGMDVVKTRIAQLSGNIEVASVFEQGTRFQIRLPLTLAIINSLLVRMRDVVFSIPLDDVREIVSLKKHEVVTVLGKQTFEVRGEYLSLFTIDRVFQWHRREEGSQCLARNPGDSDSLEVVILQSAGQPIGLRVDEFLGSQDIVIKSLSDNFVNLCGLSGASILGDGSVSLMLDVSTLIDMASRIERV